MSKPMTRRRAKPEALPPRTHEPAIEELITATQELLAMSRKATDGEYVRPWEHESLHKRVEAAIAAVRAPVAGASKLCTVEDGRKLAAAMLSQIERIDPDKAGAYLCDAYADDEKEGRIVWRTAPQVDLVGDYLQRAGNDEARSGFTRALTDFIVGAVQGSVPEARDYARPLLEIGDSKVKEART